MVLRRLILVLCLCGVSSNGVAADLHRAVRDDNRDVIQGIADSGADLDSLSGRGETPLIMAILDGKVEVVDLLLAKGAGIEARNARGFTPLHAAAYVGNVEVANILLSAGANLDDHDNFGGVSPIAVAAEEGHAEIVRLLVANGAHFDEEERHAATPLSRALWRERGDVVDVLIEAGATCQSLAMLGERYHAKCIAKTKALLSNSQ